MLRAQLFKELETSIGSLFFPAVILNIILEYADYTPPVVAELIAELNEARRVSKRILPSKVSGKKSNDETRS